MNSFKCTLLLAFCLGLSACSILPTSGPAESDVRAGQKDPASLPYAFAPITPRVLETLVKNSQRIGAVYPDRRAPKEILLGVGDVVSVTIFEAAAGGLFIPSEAGVRPGNFIALPNQAIDFKGNISVPYAGLIQAKGRTPEQVQRAIVGSLKNRAIDPQVVVAVIEQRTSLISVLGEVNSPARFPASAAGERLLDAITRAGGPKGQGFDTRVMLEREGRRADVPFGALVEDPSNNVYVHSYDTVYVYRQPQTFVAFGAAGQQGQFNFDAWQVSLAEAVGKAGGLNDTLADPASVFLYRGETRKVAEELGLDTSKYPGPIIPVIYNVNFRDPAGYFLATQFELHNKDVLYVSNASSVEAAKAMQLFRLTVATVNDPIVAATNAYILKSAIKGTTNFVVQ
ncbi:polysaccharide biosynthesis/export family protein [Bradyrhizobium sp. Pa8]|uniref:polysaccharide biosynthesis/export family protein n=1 Tax=Bradyrhizobium sp. Pa8 TaxID=3386552 RepID=UPI00403F46F6